MMGRGWHCSQRRPAGRDRGGRCGHFGEPDRGSVPTVPRFPFHRDAIRPAFSDADGASVPTVPQIATLRSAGSGPAWGFSSMAQPRRQLYAAGEAHAGRHRTQARPARRAGHRRVFQGYRLPFDHRFRFWRMRWGSAQPCAQALLWSGSGQSARRRGVRPSHRMSGVPPTLLRCRCRMPASPHLRSSRQPSARWLPRSGCDLPSRCTERLAHRLRRGLPAPCGSVCAVSEPSGVGGPSPDIGDSVCHEPSTLPNRVPQDGLIRFATDEHPTLRELPAWRF